MHSARGGEGVLALGDVGLCGIAVCCCVDVAMLLVVCCFCCLVVGWVCSCYVVGSVLLLVCTCSCQDAKDGSQRCRGF